MNFKKKSLVAAPVVWTGGIFVASMLAIGVGRQLSGNPEWQDANLLVNAVMAAIITVIVWVGVVIVSSLHRRRR